MIHLARGDILAANTEALVNAVNCAGTVGHGIAQRFRKAFPENFRAYEAACRRHEVRLGQVLVHDTGQLANPRWIINFPIRRDARRKSRLADIDTGLAALAAEIIGQGIRSIALPPLGCGRDGLEWDEVRPRIEKALGTLPDLHALVFESARTPPRMRAARRVPRMTAGRAALLASMDRYLAGQMDPTVPMQAVHALLYFQHVAGEEPKLSFTKGPYGPQAAEVPDLLAAIEGHYLHSYAERAGSLEREIEPLPAAITAARRFLGLHPAARQRSERTTALIEGFESAFGLALLGSVHCIAVNEGAATAGGAAARLESWEGYELTFTQRQVEIAWDALTAGGWLAPSREGARERSSD
jgi:O-acetyl-ADP-ribose deacetylase (regulator of RNase III)